MITVEVMRLKIPPIKMSIGTKIAGQVELSDWVRLA